MIITEWNQFRNLDLARIKRLLKKPVVVDLRNIYEPERMNALGFRYTCVGRKSIDGHCPALRESGVHEYPTHAAQAKLFCRRDLGLSD